jgi:ATP-dependent Clp protease ATP-binding subunit ClpC
MNFHFKQFTAETRRVLDFAREESRRLQHGFIGTEHLLLGLLQDDSVTGVLKALGLDAAVVRSEVEKMAPMGSEADFKRTHPLTPRAAAAIAHAAAEATILLQGSIGSEHLLVGMILEGGRRGGSCAWQAWPDAADGQTAGLPEPLDADHDG